MTNSNLYLDRGEKRPYDERKPTSPEHKAALGVIENLLDRKGIKQALEDVDDEFRVEIVDDLIAIIKAAQSTSEK